MPTIGPASAVNRAPAAAATIDTSRYYGATDSPVSVTLDSTGQRGSFTADLPLDGFKPPMSRAALQGQGVKVMMPPNEAGEAPATVVEKNGRAYLRVSVDGAEVNALRSSPISFKVSGPSGPSFVAQATTAKIQVDRTAPVLALELRNRPGLVNHVAELQSDRASLSDGTSSWFGWRQLQTENDQLAKVAQVANAAVAGPRADLEAKLLSNDFQAVFSLTPQLSANRDSMLKALEDAGNAKAKIAQLQSQRDLELSAGIPLSEDYDAQIAALQPQATAADGVHQQVLDLYQQTRTDQPFQADLWLRSYANMNGLPNADSFTDLLWSAHNANTHLANNEQELTRITAQDKAGLPGEEALVDKQLGNAKAALAAADAYIAALRSGAERPTDLFSASYAFDMKII